MAVNKIIYGGNTLIDLTSDTVDSEHLAKGYTAHGKDGSIITGTMESGGGPEQGPFTGTNIELVAEYNETFTLADTSFVKNSSSSTSATSIKATVSNRYTSNSIAFGDKDVIIIQTVYVVPIHSASTQKAMQKHYAIQYSSFATKGKSSSANATARRAMHMSTYLIDYYTSATAWTRAMANYGFYATPQAPSFASATARSTTVRVSSPILYYRASSTYESTSVIKTVTECTWSWNVKVYTADAGSTLARKVIDNVSVFLD